MFEKVLIAPHDTPTHCLASKYGHQSKQEAKAECKAANRGLNEEVRLHV